MYESGENMTSLANQIEEVENSINKIDQNAMVQFNTAWFPITVEVKWSGEMQLSIYDAEKAEANHATNQAVTFIFDDELSIVVDDGLFISEEVLNKFKNKIKKWHYLWLQWYFAQKEGRHD